MKKNITYIELEDGIFYSETLIDWIDNIGPLADEVEDTIAKFYGDYAIYPGTISGTYRTRYTDLMIDLDEDGSIKICLAEEK